jgi:PIN domain nuclease of toxin-antitoxin system
VIYLDTHVVAWLAAGETGRLSRRAQKLVNEEDLFISPVVLLELEFLREIGRLKVSAEVLVELLAAELGLVLCDRNHADVVKASLRLKWTRDPFDRLIVAQAAVAGERLLTKDETILAHYPKALWE